VKTTSTRHICRSFSFDRTSHAEDYVYIYVDVHKNIHSLLPKCSQNAAKMQTYSGLTWRVVRNQTNICFQVFRGTRISCGKNVDKHTFQEQTDLRYLCAITRVALSSRGDREIHTTYLHTSVRTYMHGHKYTHPHTHWNYSLASRSIRSLLSSERVDTYAWKLSQKSASLSPCCRSSRSTCVNTHTHTCKTHTSRFRVPYNWIRCEMFTHTQQPDHKNTLSHTRIIVQVHARLYVISELWCVRSGSNRPLHTKSVMGYRAHVHTLRDSFICDVTHSLVTWLMHIVYRCVRYYYSFDTHHIQCVAVYNSVLQRGADINTSDDKANNLQCIASCVPVCCSRTPLQVTTMQMICSVQRVAVCGRKTTIQVTTMQMKLL